MDKLESEQLKTAGIVTRLANNAFSSKRNPIGAIGIQVRQNWSKKVSELVDVRKGKPREKNGREGCSSENQKKNWRTSYFGLIQQKLQPFDVADLYLQKARVKTSKAIKNKNSSKNKLHVVAMETINQADVNDLKIYTDGSVGATTKRSISVMVVCNEDGLINIEKAV
ncbi:hypothetical protein HELRODRAFT_178566 [Helobdella robusta]|uniref:Uncharacterized protein n=1 Tax=Helobdella robusta TaxID=6412 RepID=T1FDE2_HELRO|nr:hypothetical protein HELRODRAFT_178566 [Helobdella robusta]ESN97116.1 hypothetical protein HELRODRAFT_178566 [Helobdella robusta]